MSVQNEFDPLAFPRWERLVSSALAHATMIRTLLSTEHVSVLVALESGWDLSAVLVALSELMLDSVYRTCEGFQA